MGQHNVPLGESDMVLGGAGGGAGGSPAGGTPKWAEALGIGAAGMVRDLPSLIAQIATRRKRKKQKRAAERELGRQRAFTLNELEEARKEYLERWGEASQDVESDVRERLGTRSASEFEQQMGEMEEEKGRRLAAIQRQRANLLAGYEAQDTMTRLQEAIDKVRRHAAIAEAMLSQGVSAAVGAAL